MSGLKCLQSNLQPDCRCLPITPPCLLTQKCNVWAGHSPLAFCNSFASIWIEYYSFHLLMIVVLLKKTFILIISLILFFNFWGPCNTCRAVGRGTAIQVGRSRVRFPKGVIGIFHWHNPSGRTMALGLTQPLTEMSTRNISWGQRRPVRRADNLTTTLQAGRPWVWFPMVSLEFLIDIILPTVLSPWGWLSL
jgi:hypothetical protein